MNRNHLKTTKFDSSPGIYKYAVQQTPLVSSTVKYLFRFSAYQRLAAFSLLLSSNIHSFNVLEHCIVIISREICFSSGTNEVVDTSSFEQVIANYHKKAHNTEFQTILGLTDDLDQIQ